MIHTRSQKMLLCETILGTAGQAFTSAAIDTLGYDEATIFFQIGTQADSAGNQISVLSLKEGTNTYSSNASAIAAFTGGTAGASATTLGFLIPAPNATSEQVVQMNWKQAGRERYLFASFTNPGAVMTGGVSILALGSRAKDAPAGTSEQNVAIITNG
jgi:hypothetical protein